jgi:hypothetical protein
MTFDPALGDLSVVIDPAAAATVLTAAFDGSTVRSPRRRDTKYRPLDRCEATYDLELVALGGTRRRSIGVVTVTAAGVAARRFDDDPGLPSLAEALDPERMAAGHGAMCTDQFLIDGEGGGLVLIDLDGVCLAEPARDLGNLLAYLDWKAIRRPADAAWVERAGAAFLTGYATGRSVPADRVAVYRAGSLLKIAGRRYRSLTVPEWPLVPALLDAASTTVTGGLSP